MMGLASLDIKEGIFGSVDIRKGVFRADDKRWTYRQRKINEDGFQEIAKTASSVVLSLIHFMLKIFQSVMKITMN